ARPPAQQAVPGYKVGKPYAIDGVWYYPAVDYTYDETGIASWYGPDFHGLATANGETYDMNALTAAHRTLPMPSLVRVTNLETRRPERPARHRRAPLRKHPPHRRLPPRRPAPGLRDAGPGPRARGDHGDREPPARHARRRRRAGRAADRRRRPGRRAGVAA